MDEVLNTKADPSLTTPKLEKTLGARSLRMTGQCFVEIAGLIEYRQCACGVTGLLDLAPASG